MIVVSLTMYELEFISVKHYTRKQQYQICRLAAGAGTRWCAGDTEDTEGGCEGGGGGDGGGGDPVEQESAFPVQSTILLRRLNIFLQLGWPEL